MANKTGNFSPCIIHWYMLNDNNKIYLDKSFLLNLIEKGVQRAGSQRALAKKLFELGEPFDQAKIYRLKRGKYEGLAIGKVKALLKFLDIPYESVYPSIRAIGARQSIKNVRLPIDMNRGAGGRLIAAALSDGGVYVRDKRYRKLVFNYYNNDEDLIHQIIKSVQDLVGDAHYNYNNCRLCFGSNIIPNILVHANAAIGKKTLTDLRLPSVICYGKPETVREYFRQVFADEGSVWKGAIEYKRTVNFSSLLNSGHLNELDALNWKMKGVPGKTSMWGCVNYTKELEEKISNKLKNLMLNHPPKLLIEEKKKLEEYSGLWTVIKLREIHKTKSGYTAVWGLLIFRESNIKIFAEKIGFGCKKKQEKLEDMLKDGV